MAACGGGGAEESGGASLATTTTTSPTNNGSGGGTLVVGLTSITSGGSVSVSDTHHFILGEFGNMPQWKQDLIQRRKFSLKTTTTTDSNQSAHSNDDKTTTSPTNDIIIMSKADIPAAVLEAATEEQPTTTSTTTTINNGNYSGYKDELSTGHSQQSSLSSSLINSQLQVSGAGKTTAAGSTTHTTQPPTNNKNNNSATTINTFIKLQKSETTTLEQQETPFQSHSRHGNEQNVSPDNSSSSSNSSGVVEPNNIIVVNKKSTFNKNKALVNNVVSSSSNSNTNKYQKISERSNQLKNQNQLSGSSSSINSGSSTKMVAMQELSSTDNFNFDDSSEELKYGPGIVSKLRCRYLSLALRQAAKKTRPSLDNMRRATSLNNLLDEEDDGASVVNVRKNWTNSNGNRPCSDVVKATTPDEFISTFNRNHYDASRCRPTQRGTDSPLKRARSVEALMRYDQNAWQRDVIKEAADQNIFALDDHQENFKSKIFTDTSGVTIEDKIQNGRERGEHKPKRLTSFMDETERPPPDLVKHTLRIFEATANRRPRHIGGNGEVASKVAQFKSIISQEKPVIVFPKPPLSPKKPTIKPRTTSPKHVILTNGNKSLNGTSVAKQSSPVKLPTKQSSSAEIELIKQNLEKSQNRSVLTSPQPQLTNGSLDLDIINIVEKPPQPAQRPIVLSPQPIVSGNNYRSPSPLSPTIPAHVSFNGAATNCSTPKKFNANGESVTDSNVRQVGVIRPQLKSNQSPTSPQPVVATTTTNTSVSLNLKQQQQQQSKKDNLLFNNESPILSNVIKPKRDNLLISNLLAYNSSSPSPPPQQSSSVVTSAVTQTLNNSSLTSREIEKNLINKEKSEEAAAATKWVTAAMSPAAASTAPTTPSAPTTTSPSPPITVTAMPSLVNKPPIQKPWQQSAEHQNSMVFNFSNRKDVPDYIENDGLVVRRNKRELPKPNESGFVLLGDLTVETSTDPDDSWTLGPPSPCDVEFQNDNVIIDGKSNLRDRSSRERELKIHFNDTLNSIFEYPSEKSLLEEDIHSVASIDLMIDDDVCGSSDNGLVLNSGLLGSMALGSAPLGNYTPVKASFNTNFELGVTRSQSATPPFDAASTSSTTSNGSTGSSNTDATYSVSDASVNNGDVTSESLQYLKPATDEQTVAWSEGTRAGDLLF